MQKKKLHPLSLQRIENIFFLNGITAILGWNAALGAFDYFSYVYKGYDVYLYFPVPVFIAYAVTGILFKKMSTTFSYGTIVAVGIIGMNISLALMLVFSILFKDSVDLGFLLTLIVGFFLGFFNNIAQLSFFAMINYFGMLVVSRFTIGTAASGLLVIVLRAIITAIFGAEISNVVPIIIYFSLSVVFNIFDLILNLRLFSSQEYIQKIVNKTMNQDKSLLSQKQRQKTTTLTDSEQNKSYPRLMYEAYKVTTPYPLYIFFDYLITFMLFPSLTLTTKTSFGGTWTSILMIIMYNLGDLLGKIIGDFRGSFNNRSIAYLLICRLFFFYTIPLMDKQFTQEDHLLNNDYFPFFNQLLFMFTNGLVVNGSFIISFEKAPIKYKNYAGVLGGLFLQFGIMLGTFLAIPLQTFIGPDVPDS